MPRAEEDASPISQLTAQRIGGTRLRRRSRGPHAPMRDALIAGTIPGRAGDTAVVPDSSLAHNRLLGAVALVTAPGYAALAVG